MNRIVALLFLLFVTLPAQPADYNTQLATYKQTNSSQRSVAILNATNPVLSDTLGANSTHAQTNTTLANVADVEVAVLAGKTYLLRAVLPVTANVGGGNKIDLAGGTATATSFRGVAKIFIAGGVATVALTALNTAAGATAVNTLIEIEARIVVNAGGTIVLRHAQNASHASDSIIYAGASLTAQEL